MKTLFLFSVFSLQLVCFAQLPKIPVTIGGFSTDKVTKGTKTLLTNQLDKSKAEYDTTSFNYAISLSDNAGLYENEERWLRNQKLFADFLRQSDGTQNTPQQNADQYNELGEMMYASNKFTSAENAFDASKKIYEANSLPAKVITVRSLAT